MRLHLAAALLTLASCATERDAWHPPLVLPDTVRLDASQPAPRKLKARTIIYQYGQGNVAEQADNRKAGSKQGSAALGEGSTAGNASKRTAGPPWWVYVGVAVLGAWLWSVVRAKLAAWRAQPG